MSHQANDKANDLAPYGRRSDRDKKNILLGKTYAIRDLFQGRKERNMNEKLFIMHQFILMEHFRCPDDNTIATNKTIDFDLSELLLQKGENYGLHSAPR